MQLADLIRRRFLKTYSLATLGVWASGKAAPPSAERTTPGAHRSATVSPGDSTQVTLFLTGDVMTGRGIDQMWLPRSIGAGIGATTSPGEQTTFAHRLIDEAAVDVIHGHSSHHEKGIEVYQSRPIIYGCGDFINDYEGIGGYKKFRSELGLMYFVTLSAGTGELVDLRMTPTRIKRFRVHRADHSESQWLTDVLNREGGRLGTAVRLGAGGTLSLTWMD